MKDKNLPNDYSDLSLEELTNEANKMIEYLENQKDLEKTMENYQNLIKINNIIESSETILWNGPAGYFENPNFANGSFEIAKKIVEKNKNNSIFSVAGGGDTIAVINKLNAFGYFNFISTAGGAFLEYLEGKELPGIKALN